MPLATPIPVVLPLPPPFIAIGTELIPLTVVDVIQTGKVPMSMTFAPVSAGD